MKKQSASPKKIEIDADELRALVAELVEERLRAMQAGERKEPAGPAASAEQEYGVEWVAC